MEYHVSIRGSDKNNGTEKNPFKTISKAAGLAQVGDRVVVHEGVYREWVSPEHSGYSDNRRIIYEAAEGENVVIKGSEIIQDWKKNGRLWSVCIDNKIFNGYNPYEVTIDGDWLMRPVEPFLNTGAVYLNGIALTQTLSPKETKANTWYAEVNDDTTVIYADFGDADPNNEEVEINVRKCCFYPEKTGMNYITVRGFEMAHAATPWSPPTADQPGMLGTHWSKGWIIENNILHDSRCCAISLGKEVSTGNNLYTKRHRKSGYQYQLETVFRARHIGWSKERIGSHIIRNNVIYDCGQNGIVGNLGGAFSEIYENHIYNIGNKQEFFGYEIAGIKLHAAIDVQIHNNVIHDCFWGTWLDWQAQGARISSNLYYNNEKDFWIEVTHGPYLMDNNIFGSENNITNNAQGGAYVHNLFCGRIQRYDVRNRSTPYHLPHSTEVAGCALVYGGDDRYYNNIFCGADEGSEDFRKNWHGGTAFYNEYPSSLEEYIENVLKHGRGDIETFECEKQPVYINKNCYLNGTAPYINEKSALVSGLDPKARIYTEGGMTYLEITVPEDISTLDAKIITTKTLPVPRICEQPFETGDGKEIRIDTDYNNKSRNNKPTVGPFEDLKPGKNRILLC